MAGAKQSMVGRRRTSNSWGGASSSLGRADKLAYVVGCRRRKAPEEEGMSPFGGEGEVRCVERRLPCPALVVGARVS
jgi:hypothetical protein